MKGFLIFLAVAFSALAYADHDERAVETLNLLGRSHTSSEVVKLDEADWHWLRSKDSLVLGTSRTASAPFELSSNKSDYEGLAADYAEMLADSLHVKIVVRRYHDQAEASAALKRGEVDLLGVGGLEQSNDPQLVVSQAYTDDPPVLVTRRGTAQPLPIKLNGLRLAMQEHYLTPAELAKLYPEAALSTYPSAAEALNAVAFGQADVYAGGGIGANYLINRYRLTDLRLAAFIGSRQGELGFVMRRENTPLLRMVNRALDAVLPNERLAIAQRWKATPVAVHGRDHVVLSPEEQHWLAANPKLKVAVLAGNPPLTFSIKTSTFAASVRMYWSKSAVVFL